MPFTGGHIVEVIAVTLHKYKREPKYVKLLTYPGTWCFQYPETTFVAITLSGSGSAAVITIVKGTKNTERATDVRHVVVLPHYNQQKLHILYTSVPA
jgi:hypothetical protein